MAAPAEPASNRQPLLDAQGAEALKSVQGVGLATILVTAGMAATYLWLSKQVPDTCNSNMSTYFLLMGVCQAVAILPMACLMLAAKQGASLLAHADRAEKSKEEGRTEEADQEAALASKETGTLIAEVATGGCVLCLLQPILFGLFIYGLVQALKADSTKCGEAVTAFWLLFVLGILQACSRPAGRVEQSPTAVPVVGPVAAPAPASSP